MYLDGVGPNSSVDCFGFVTVQMTFNGLGLGVSGREVVTQTGGVPEAWEGFWGKQILFGKRFSKESWVEWWCLLVSLFLFCLEREAYLGHQCVCVLLYVCVFWCWILVLNCRTTFELKLVPARWSTSEEARSNILPPLANLHWETSRSFSLKPLQLLHKYVAFNFGNFSTMELLQD